MDIQNKLVSEIALSGQWVSSSLQSLYQERCQAESSASRKKEDRDKYQSWADRVSYSIESTGTGVAISVTIDGDEKKETDPELQEFLDDIQPIIASKAHDYIQNTIGMLDIKSILQPEIVSYISSALGGS